MLTFVCKAAIIIGFGKIRLGTKYFIEVRDGSVQIACVEICGGAPVISRYPRVALHNLQDFAASADRQPQIVALNASPPALFGCEYGGIVILRGRGPAVGDEVEYQH